MHRCDVRNCVRPDHLCVGTEAENIADRDAKGRGRTMRGADNGFVTMTDERRAEVVARLKAGESAMSICRSMQTTPRTVRRAAIKAGLPVRPSRAPTKRRIGVVDIA